MRVTLSTLSLLAVPLISTTTALPSLPNSLYHAIEARQTLGAGSSGAAAPYCSALQALATQEWNAFSGFLGTGAKSDQFLASMHVWADQITIAINDCWKLNDLLVKNRGPFN